MFVGRKYRRKGIGKELLMLVINRCAERGFQPAMMAVTNNGWALIESLPQEVRDKCGEIRRIPGIEIFPF